VKRFKAQVIRNRKLGTRSYQVALADIPADRQKDFRPAAK
jgi:hypothetical protein